ncbi:MAG: glutathione S-transferase family protein [Alphaproteobacteria bacterium]|jgi:glutathione S-transferase|nr:glutathione S-transferase family protein [Alphaproteobacteria bacterium]
MKKPITFYYASGSPYAWRVWLALEHKGLDYALKVLSFDRGDLQQPDFAALNPRQRVPVLVEGDFTLRESTVIVEYLDEQYADRPKLFASDAKAKAQQRLLIREADNYIQPALEEFGEAIFTPEDKRKPGHLGDCVARLNDELAIWERSLEGDYVTGEVSAVDFTLYPQLALIERFSKRLPSDAAKLSIGSRLQRWMTRMQALEVVKKTWPPHWK